MSRRRQPVALTLTAISSLGLLVACGGGPTSPSGEASSTVAAAPAGGEPGNCGTVDPASLVEKGTLTVSTSGSAPPLDYLDADGKPAGMYIDLAQKWAADLGIENVKFVNGPFSSMLAGLTAGKWDIGGAAVGQTPERLSSTTFVLSDPYVRSGTTVAVTKESGITTWEQLSGKRLGGAVGQAEYEAAMAEVPDATPSDFPGANEARQALRSGLIDAVAGDSSELLYWLDELPDGNKYTLVSEVISADNGGTALRNENTELIDGINCEVKEMLADGSMRELAIKYFGSPMVVDDLLAEQGQPTTGG